MLGIKTRGWMRQLQKKGYVKNVPSNVNSGEVWVLTNEGLAVAQGSMCKSFTHYPARPERLSQASLRHDLAVQKIVVSLVEKGEAIAIHHPSEFAPGGTPEAWIPDAWITHKDGYKVGLEYERNPKYGEERLVKLNRITEYLNSRNQGEKKVVVRWYSQSPECLKEYKNLMQNGMPWRGYASYAKRWLCDDQDDKRTTQLSIPEGCEVVLLEKDLAKYM